MDGPYTLAKGFHVLMVSVCKVSGFWNIVGWVFTNPYCAGFILFLGCAIPAVLAVVMFLHYPALDIDISYNAFEIRNHESSQRFDALALALKSQFGSWGRNRRDLADFTSETLQRLIFEQLQQLHLNASHLGVSARVKRSTPEGRMSSPKPHAHLNPGNWTSRTGRGTPRWDYSSTYISANTQTHAHWRIELIFLARGDSENNIFTTERLVTIHEVERKIMDHPRFREFCWKPHEVLKDLPLGSYSYCSPPSSLMTYFFPTERGGKIYYDGMGQDLADIQGELRAGVFKRNVRSWIDNRDKLPCSIKQMKEVCGLLWSLKGSFKVQVLYGGTDLFDYEVRRTFNNDMWLAFISSSCIAVLVYILTSCSVFLSFFGIASIGLSCLVALFLYHVVFGIQYLGILNGVAAFVIVGIGVDDVFVFINTYRQATHLKDLRLRMIHTIQTAGKATFFTSLTTAAAYAANIFSQIPAVHDFGLFMSLIVSCCWVAVLFTMPAALGIWTLYVSPLESSCQTSCSQKCTKKSALHLAEDLFIASEATSRAGRETLPYLDDDIPLLSVEEEPVSLEMGDVPLVSVMPENLQLPAEKCNRGHLITHLQELLEHWVLWSAVKSRWVIVGLFLLVLLLSIFFASRLQPASRAPVLFRPDTNIQVLLDLKYNLSAEGISCITCSVGLLKQTSPRKWMMTTLSCDTKRGWKFDFSFYVAAKEQQRTRKLYFAQSHKPPYHGRVCVAPPGCLLSSSPDGPTKGILYVPSEKAAPKAKLSATSGFNPCMNTGCGKPAVRPLVDTGAMVFVVFGIRGVNRTRHPDNHVIGDMGSVIYDDSFDLFKEIGNLCRLCKAIASNTELVKPGGAQCLPSGYSISAFLQMLHPECKNIPEPNLLPGQLSHGAVGVKDGKVQWISMAFESTTYKGTSSFQTYADYLKWETFLQQQLQLFPEGSALRNGFQTWVVCLVVTIMYWSGWEMGAVEAISLSILVGSSVDYCVHLVEGYLLAGENLPLHHAEDPTACRQWRTIEAVRHVGVAIVSSAVTTVIATVPLFFCIIAPFAKFGKIVALNTGVSILYTLTVSTALLSIMGPGTFIRSRTSCLKAVVGVLLAGLLGLCICLALLKSGFKIPLPDGTTL
ncbi:patched domain-containing protein 2 [Limosa lapponica baueri]|uniref:Patched domain-containing protein 2 n=1 Tax=Limosa lapponica baueri TaxID=1758121 RepID=A0A2I0TGJ6_LIMLA|nr:patched domain-containing protein 2 [Limosa lapponica baueri]